MTHMALSDDQCPATLKRMLLTSDGRVKPVLHFEVDGGPDENPNHLETRLLLAEICLGGPFLNPQRRRKQASASTRESNGSCKNGVERENGCVQQSIAGMIFNTDACGDLHDEATGQLDEAKRDSMWKHHQQRYIDAVDGSPGLNGATMSAFPGSVPETCDEARVLLQRRPLFVEYIKSTTSRKRRAEINSESPMLVKHIEVLKAFLHHGETAGHYESTVRACDDPNCRLGCALAPVESMWWPDGPRLMPFPPVYRDPGRPGHYLGPQETLAKYAEKKFSRTDGIEYPSITAAAAFEKETKEAPLDPFPDDRIEHTLRQIGDASLDRNTLVTHMAHLRYVRLRALEGVRKAADTRNRNRQKREGSVAAAAAAARVPQPHPPRASIRTYLGGNGGTVGDSGGGVEAMAAQFTQDAASAVAAASQTTAAATAEGGGASSSPASDAEADAPDANADDPKAEAPNATAAASDAEADARDANADDPEAEAPNATAAAKHAAPASSGARKPKGKAKVDATAAASNDAAASPSRALVNSMKFSELAVDLRGSRARSSRASQKYARSSRCQVEKTATATASPWCILPEPSVGCRWTRRT